jgi:hypothetical protein
MSLSHDMPKCRALAAFLAIAAPLAAAQELEPRAYSPAPVGTNFLVIGAAHQSGKVLPDPTVPITDAEVSADSALVGYQRSFGLLGRNASIGLGASYTWLDAEGNVGGTERERSVGGVGDARIRFAVGLLGAPALTPEEFARRTPEPLVGTSLTIVAPTGQYDSSKLVNVGSNRWAFKPEIGVSLPFGKAFVEAATGVWLFTDNDDFFGGQRKEQDPLSSLQLHAGYNFRPGFWLAADATYYAGGRSTVDGVEKDDRQKNSRYGLTLAYPLTSAVSLKASWAKGAFTRIGGDFETFSLFLQYRWYDRAAAAP